MQTLRWMHILRPKKHIDVRKGQKLPGRAWQNSRIQQTGEKHEERIQKRTCIPPKMALTGVNVMALPLVGFFFLGSVLVGTADAFLDVRGHGLCKVQMASFEIVMIPDVSEMIFFFSKSP